MVNEQPQDGVQPNVNDSVAAEESGNSKDMVAYESHQRVLKEKKRRDQEVRELQEKLNLVEQQKMEAEGNKDELIKSLRSQLDETSTKLKEKDQTYAWNVVSEQLKNEARNLGCSNPDKLLKLMEKSDFDAIEVDDNFRVNRDDAIRILEKQKEVIPEFFRKSINAPRDGVPKTPEVGAKNVQDLSGDELWAKINSMS